MASNVIFFGWNRPIPGHEQTSAAHFAEFTQYLSGLQHNGTIQSFDAVFLSAHGGDLNGFFLIRGESAKLDALMAMVEWETHIIRAGFHLEGEGVVRGTTGELVMEQMKLWTSLIPK